MFKLNVVKDKSFTFESTDLMKEFASHKSGTIPVVCSNLTLIGSGVVVNVEGVDTIQVLLTNPGVVEYLKDKPMDVLDVDVYTYAVNGLPVPGKNGATQTKVRAIRTPFTVQ